MEKTTAEVGIFACMAAFSGCLVLSDVMVLVSNGRSAGLFSVLAVLSGMFLSFFIIERIKSGEGDNQ